MLTNLFTIFVFHYNQMFAMCNILFIVYYYLFVMFNFLFVTNNHLFVLLKYLFPVTKNNYNLKIITDIITKGGPLLF